MRKERRNHEKHERHERREKVDFRGQRAGVEWEDISRQGKKARRDEKRSARSEIAPYPMLTIKLMLFVSRKTLNIKQA